MGAVSGVDQLREGGVSSLEWDLAPGRDLLSILHEGLHHIEHAEDVPYAAELAAPYRQHPRGHVRPDRGRATVLTEATQVQVMAICSAVWEGEKDKIS